jgi:hypothetical protein
LLLKLFENNSFVSVTQFDLGVADCGMKNNFALFQNPCGDVALQRLYIQIHTSIQQHLI